mgnify:CR=1 FL=1
MADKYDDYLKFIDDALELAKAIPRYFSKFSNKIYCNHQKLAIYVLMQKFKTTTRGIVSMLRASSDMRLMLGLNRVPVHTTIVRFAARIKKIIGKLLGIRQATTVALDASGFELEAKSFYYRNIDIKHKNYQSKTKQYMKLSIAIDADKQLILTHKIRKKLRNDTIDFRPLLEKLKVKYVLADKGYDSKANRLFVLCKLKAIPNIPYRRCSGITKLRGRNRAIFFDGKTYHQRSKVETVFSVIKRKYGSILRSRSFATQKVELISKLIAYNLDRNLNYLLLLIRGLHQSAIILHCNVSGSYLTQKNLFFLSRWFIPISRFTIGA